MTKFKTIIGAPKRFINCLKCLAPTIANGSTTSKLTFYKNKLKTKTLKIIINLCLLVVLVLALDLIIKYFYICFYVNLFKFK